MLSELSPDGWQSSDPPQRPVLFVNPRSGGGKAARAAVAERARERGIQTVIFAPGQSLDALAQDAVADGADALGVAGGDGSMAVVAAVAAAHRLPARDLRHRFAPRDRARAGKTQTDASRAIPADNIVPAAPATGREMSKGPSFAGSGKTPGSLANRQPRRKHG